MPKLPDVLRTVPERNGHNRQEGPALLVSFVYLKQFLKLRHTYNYRVWVMDSGAFSAFTSGTEIDLEVYAERCKELLATDKTLAHVFSLDVIGDPEGTLRNTERLWKLGVPAVPTFHRGSPWHYLTDMANRYPKIALGGMALRGKGGHGTALTYNKKLEFIEQYFGRIWPHWVHGFGCCDRRLLKKLPFAAVDSTSWLYGTARYGVVQAFSGGNILPKRKDNPSAYAAGVRTQVAWHMDIEDDIRRRFGSVLLNAGFGQFNLHLASSGDTLDQGQPQEKNNGESDAETR